MRPTSCTSAAASSRSMREAADGAAPSRGRASRRRPCARAARPRTSGGRRSSRAARASRRVRRLSSTRSTSACRPGCEISAARNSRKPSSSSASRRIAGAIDDGIDVLRGLERAHVELQPVAEPLDASEHAHGVALGEARVEQLDVVPDARGDAPARIDELEREIRPRRSSCAGAASSRPRRRPRPCGSPRAARSRSRRSLYDRRRSRCGSRPAPPSARSRG